MRYNLLGQTGLYVSELCLGTMTFGGRGDVWSKIGDLGQPEAEALIKTAVEAGINFIDTADVYSEGKSEEIVGLALRNLGIAREDIVVATKGFGRVGTTPGPNRVGATRSHILAACKASLKRLGLDHIDLYQLHGYDQTTPIEEMLEALDILVRHGHVRYVGVSNWSAWQVSKALGIAERRNLAPPRSLQSYYTLAGRDIEREIVPMLLSEKRRFDGVEPARRRPALRQIRSWGNPRHNAGPGPPCELRLSARGSRSRPSRGGGATRQSQAKRAAPSHRSPLRGSCISRS